VALQRLPKNLPESEKKTLTPRYQQAENENATPSETSMGSTAPSSQASAPAALGGVAIASDPQKARAAGADAWDDGATVTVSFSGPPGAIEDLLRRLLPGRSA